MRPLRGNWLENLTSVNKFYSPTAFVSGRPTSKRQGVSTGRIFSPESRSFLFIETESQLVSTFADDENK
jgi:hypothetical protein